MQVADSPKIPSQERSGVIRDSSTLIADHGAICSAIAWSLRAITESLLMFRIVRKTVDVTGSSLSKRWYRYGAAYALLALPAALFQFMTIPLTMTICMAIASFLAYGAAVCFYCSLGRSAHGLTQCFIHGSIPSPTR